MKGSLLPLFSDKSTRTKDTAVNLHWIHCEPQEFKRNKNKHILHANWCESTAQIFGLFGDQKYSDSVGRIWFIHEERRNVTNSKLDWAVVFTARYEEKKQLILARDCANRQRPLPTYLATTRAIYQGTEAESACGVSVRYCANRQGRSRTCWPTLESHGNRSWQEYCDIFTDAVN